VVNLSGITAKTEKISMVDMEKFKKNKGGDDYEYELLQLLQRV
jgi:hypothetical protein